MFTKKKKSYLRFYKEKDRKMLKLRVINEASLGIKIADKDLRAAHKSLQMVKNKK